MNIFCQTLFDIAVTLSEGEDRTNLDPKDWQQQQAAFFAGYQKVLPLPAGYKEYISLFKIIRVIDLVNWVMSWPRPDLKAWGPGYLKHAVILLQTFLGKQK